MLDCVIEVLLSSVKQRLILRQQRRQFLSLRATVIGTSLPPSVAAGVPPVPTSFAMRSSEAFI